MRESFRAFSKKLQIYLQLLWISYAAAAVWVFPHSRLEVVAALTSIFAGASLVRPVPYPLGGITDPNSGLVIAAALLWLPQEVLLGVGIGSFIGLILFRKNEVWRACNNGAGWGLPAGAASAVAHAVSFTMSPSLISLVVGAVLAVLTNRLMNTVIFAVYRSERFGHPFFADWRQSIAFQWPSQLLGSAPLAVVLASIASRIGTVGAGLALTAAYALALPVARQEYAYYIRARQMLDETVEAVVRALEGNDPAARAHGDRVSILAVEIGRRLGMSERGLLALRLASRLHDVGLLAGPESPSAQGHHAAVGNRILAQFPDPMTEEFVRAHHERWDGYGAPDHRRGKEIPLGARVLAAAETYDSFRTGLSPFQGPNTQEDAALYLRSLAGNVLDPKVVTILLNVAGERDTSDRARAG